MMTNKFAIVLSGIVFMSMNCRTNGRPMDSVAAERLPDLKAIVQSIQSGDEVAPASIEKLRGFLRSGDPVLVSIASWCVMNWQPGGNVLQPELSNINKEVGDLPYAFVTLARERKDSAQLSEAERIERLENLAASKNPYLKVEAAKELFRMDKSAGKKLLSKLAQEAGNTQSSTEASRALRKIERSEGKESQKPLPHADERYRTVLSIIE